MTVATKVELPVDSELLYNYFKTLVNHFFKILPMRENEEQTLPTYLRSLQIELIGGKDFIPTFNTDAGYLTLLNILEYLISNPDCTLRETRREVFRAISICNKLKAVYSGKEGLR